MELVRNAVAETDARTAVVLCAEEELRDLIAYWLAALPLRSFVAADGYEANRLVRGVRAGVIVTDRVLPPWPGLETFRQLRAANPALDVAYIDDGSPDARILARLSGATLVLQRPLTRQKMIEALGRIALGV